MARLGQGQSHTYTLRGTGGPVTLTLSWYDYPAHVNAAKQLVNDLDLSVVVKQNAVVKARLSGNGAASGDSVNTVERIEIPALKKGAVLTIKVTAKTIFAKAPSQPYALVALGRFTGALRSQNALPGTLPVRKRMKKR